MKLRQGLAAALALVMLAVAPVAAESSSRDTVGAPHAAAKKAHAKKKRRCARKHATRKQRRKCARRRAARNHPGAKPTDSRPESVQPASTPAPPATAPPAPAPAPVPEPPAPPAPAPVPEPPVPEPPAPPAVAEPPPSTTGPGPDLGGLIFEDGFSRTGLFSAAWRIQRAGPDRIQLVPSPGGSTPYAARFEVRPGDVVAPGTGTGNRAEIYSRGWNESYPDGLGSERWYGLSYLLPADSPTSKYWQVLTQWKNEGAGSPPLSINLDGERLSITAQATTDPTRTTKIWQGPLVRGVWTRFVVHVNWSPDPAVGFVEAWRDGRVVVPYANRATMFLDKEGNPLRNYLKVGLYRSAAIPDTQWMYAEDVRIGSSYAQVAG